MNDVMAVALQAMQRDVAALERVGSNFANALTPGYKRETLRHASAAAAAPRFADVLQREVAGAQARDASAVARDFRAGTLKATGQPLDLALAGPGFFEVATPAGPAYTRNGQFRLDERGRLVTQAGHPVAGRAGEIVLLPGPVAVDAAGVVSQAGAPAGQLRIVAFDAPQALVLAEGGFVADAAAPQPPLDDGVQAGVRQGFLENANVDPMREMVELLRTTRHFESMSRVLQNCDEMLGTAIRRLGES